MVLTTRQPIFPIVGVGASAGGIDALEGFFQSLPPNPGLAFIVATHLSPDRERLLHQIITRYTNLAVAVAEDGVEVCADCVYVLPADAIISIAGGRLQLRKSNSSRRERKPIDILLSSLAMDRGEYAASVILSGGDRDGTLGTKAIKECGGLTLAQVADGHGPAHASMPNSAISTGLIDFAMPAGEMGAKLVEFARLLAEADDGAGSDEDRSNARREICAILRNQIGHDFSGYKSKTFLRRVQRRMQVTQLESQDAYVERLKQDPKEVSALFRDLLINVTNFFRDPEAFEELRELVIPKLFEGRGAEDTVRVWVPGCATGEEVYSIAILLRDHISTLTAAPRVQVFATDIDEHALGVARAARYPEALLAGVPEHHRQKFFVSDGGGFVVAKEVRDLCIFSPHSVIRDPPFSRLDLISCRNLLIYFGADVQNLVFPTFHYSLRASGYLFLGLSESVGKFADLFAPVDKKHRIFRRREDIIAPRLPMTVRSHAAPGTTNLDRREPVRAASLATVRQSLQSQVLERFAPAHVLVTHGGDILHLSVRTQKYLELSPGAPTRQLMTLARKGLRLDLRSAFREAVETDAAAVRQGVAVTSDDGSVQLVDFVVEPLAERTGHDPLYVVVFQDHGPSLSAEQAQGAIPDSDTAPTLLLERELRDTKERLQSLVEEYETALEELRSANEELLSVNEEMQSSNEELEASKEELHSLNEELNTVNSELHSKVDALDRANSDLHNLFESTQIPTVFLDRNLVIRSFTPSVRSLFNILPRDRGRLLTDLTSRLSLPGLVEDIESVFERGEIVERQVYHKEADAHLMLRLSPYLAPNQQLDGVVVTFVDVSRLAKAQAHQQTLIAELNHRVKNMLMVVIGIAQQTHKSAPTPAAFLEAFIGRLKSMSRSYELLSRQNWTESSLAELIHTEITPIGPDRLSVDGPDIKLKPKFALSLGMVLHELATNAGRHGALSTPNGRIAIQWFRSEAKSGQVLSLDWTESGGPPVCKPATTGFGLKLIHRETSYNLGGQAVLEFAQGGLSANLTFPLDACL